MKEIKIAFVALLTAGLTSMASAQSEPASHQAPANAGNTEVENVAPTSPAEAPEATEEKANAEIREEVAEQPKLSPADRKETLSEMAAEEEGK